VLGRLGCGRARIEEGARVGEVRREGTASGRNGKSKRNGGRGREGLVRVADGGACRPLVGEAGPNGGRDFLGIKGALVGPGAL